MSRMMTTEEMKGKRSKVRKDGEKEIHCLWISGVLPPGRITTTGLAAYVRRLRRPCNGAATFT